jgi:hypothetical protein
MKSSDPNVDLELLAAFIDGRVSGEDRERAVKLLAESDEALEILAHATREHEARSDIKVVPIARPPRWRQWKVIVPVLAAAGIAIVTVPRIANRHPQAVLANQYALELARDPRFTAGLPEGWEQRGWAVTRGAGAVREAAGTRQAGSPQESRLAFRLGVRTLDLQVALLRGDTALARILIGEISAILNSVLYADPVAVAYNELKSQLTTATRAQLIEHAANAERELRDLLNAPSFAYGQWVAAAELAARIRDASFFETGHGTEFIRSTSEPGALAAADSDALRRIDETRAKQGFGDRGLDEVHEVLQNIIRVHGG